MKSTQCFCLVWVGLVLFLWFFLQKWTNVSLTHVLTGPLVSVRTIHISVYVYRNTKDGIVTKVTQANISVLKARNVTTKLLTATSLGGPTETLSQTFYGCLYKNGGCEHFCVEVEDSVHQCHCATGYSLAADNRSCVSQGRFWHDQNEDMMYKSYHIPLGPIIKNSFSDI